MLEELEKKLGNINRKVICKIIYKKETNASTIRV